MHCDGCYLSGQATFNSLQFSLFRRKCTFSFGGLQGLLDRWKTKIAIRNPILLFLAFVVGGFAGFDGWGFLSGFLSCCFWWFPQFWWLVVFWWFVLVFFADFLSFGGWWFFYGFLSFGGWVWCLVVHLNISLFCPTAAVPSELKFPRRSPHSQTSKKMKDVRLCFSTWLLI